MPFDRRFPSAIVCLASSLLASGQVAAQAPAATQDVQMMQQAEALSAQGQHAEAAKVYEEMVAKFPQVPSVPEANFRGGYAHYLAGNYEAALAAFKRVIDNKNLPPEFATIKEMSLSMTPQVLAAKAAKLPLTDPARKAALEEAVKQFDVYLGQYPTSDEAESANYGKALALYQLEKFPDSIEVLRGNLTKFAASPTVQDSQYLLALTLATVASQEMQKPTPNVQTADAQYDEAEKFLRDIIGKNQNLALINDAYFQIGELLLARGGFLTGPDNKQKQDEIFGKSLEAYRSVASKDRVVAAQKQRVAFFKDLMIKAGTAKDTANFQKNKRLVDKETEKLAALEGRSDQTQTALFKTGLIFFTQNKLDETRVLFSHLESIGAIESEDDKKQALYFVTMSYAMQNVADKAVEKYEAFQAAYKGDPIGQNLQLIMGAMYLDSASKVKDANKAIEYFNEGLKQYPTGKAFGTLVLARAGARIDLKQYAEAEKELLELRAQKPPKELAVDVEFYIASAQVQTQKLKEAVETFKNLRQTYPGTPQAEEAHAQVAQLLVSLDPKAAIPEAQAYLNAFPKGESVPAVMMALGQAQAGAGEKDAALATLKKLAVDHPKSDRAPFTYFERARILGEMQKFEECLAVMKEFVAQYPDDPGLFKAYDFMAQILTSSGKGVDAIAVYEEFLTKRPKEGEDSPTALLKIAGLWRSYTESQGNYIVIEEAKRVEWKKGIEKATAAAEKLLTEFPESPQVAQALNTLMDVQRKMQTAKLKTEAELETYFKDLAAKFADKPGTQAKVIFTLASFTYTKDRNKAVEQMDAAFKPDLKFAPEDLDLYGQALIESKKVDQAITVYEKINTDNPLPPGDPKGAPREVLEAQAIYLAGLAKALQEKGDPESKGKGAKLFAELEAKYPWSPKMLEVNYGTAVSLFDEGKYEEAGKRLQEVIRAQKSTAELRAKSMLLLGKIHEKSGRFEMAIDSFIKISVFYKGVPKVAAEGLWLGGQLLERQASGDIPMPTPTPKPGAAKDAPKK